MFLVIDDTEAQRHIEALHTAYVRCIDDDRLETWPDLFVEPFTYKVTTRENQNRGLPLGIIECTSRGMLLDRVEALRRVNVYEPQTYLHQISALQIERESATRFACRSNYLVVRTMGDGEMSLFSAGVYMDVVEIADGAARFRERIVVAESRRIDTLLVIPL